MAGYPGYPGYPAAVATGYPGYPGYYPTPAAYPGYPAAAAGYPGYPVAAWATATTATAQAAPPSGDGGGSGVGTDYLAAAEGYRAVSAAEYHRQAAADYGRDYRDYGRGDYDRGRDRDYRDDHRSGRDDRERDRRRRAPDIFGDQPIHHKINRGRANPGCNVYVHRIPMDWDEIEFARHFDHFGELISCSLVRDKDNGQSRGFGFIGYAEPEAVRKAILGMDGLPVGPPLELPGKFLSVSPKRGEEHMLIPFPDCYPPAGTYGTEPANVRAPPGANLYVYNIPNDWRDIDLYRHFIHYGQLTSVKVMMKDENKESRGFGFVGFVNPVSAQRAIAGMHNFCLDANGGKRLQVTIKRGEEQVAQKVRKEIAVKDPAHPDYQQDPAAENQAEAGAALASSLGVKSH